MRINYPKMLKRFLFIPIIFIFSAKLLAQSNDNSISGIIQDKSSKQFVEFATVELLQSRDSTILKTTVTDRKGKFLIDNIESGNYILRCSFIGYSITLMPVLVDQKKENAGLIEIETLTKTLGEVVVTGR